MSHLFERFGLDFVDPLTESTLGNKYIYILVIIGYDIRLPLAIATASAIAGTIAKLLYTRKCFVLLDIL